MSKNLFSKKRAKKLSVLAGLTGGLYCGLKYFEKYDEALIYAGGISRAMRCVGYGLQIIANYKYVKINLNLNILVWDKRRDP